MSGERDDIDLLNKLLLLKLAPKSPQYSFWKPNKDLIFGLALLAPASEIPNARQLN
jgi:hypothetical protein